MTPTITYYTKDEVIAGRGFRVVAKDAQGITRGEYTGYWKPEYGTITLYPAKGSWIYGRLDKHTVHERQIRRIY